MLARMCAPLMRICKKQEKKKRRNKNKEKQKEELEELKKNTSSTIFGYTEPGAGKKKFECQDTYSIIDLPEDHLKFYAVFDGHGNVGRQASLLARDYSDDQIRKNSKKLRKMKDKEQVKKFLSNMFNNCQKKYKKNQDYWQSGTCCIAVLQIDQRLYVANIGDSRAVLCTSRSLQHAKKAEICAFELSSDHKPNRQIEKERIIKAGGKIDRDEKSMGPYRIWADDEGPGLAVARTLGDLHGHKIGISNEPEIEVWDVDVNDVFVVIGSDGVWDVISSAEAVGFISKNPEDPSQMARMLTNESRERWDLFNEINRTKKKLSLEGWDEVRKKASLQKFEDNIMRDDITVVVSYLQNIHQL